MIKLVTSPADLKGFDPKELYTVHRVDTATPILSAIATSLEEAHDAHEMLVDLTGKLYHISLPRAAAN